MTLEEYFESFSDEREEWDKEKHGWAEPRSLRDELRDDLEMAICSGKTKEPFIVVQQEKFCVEGHYRYEDGDQSRTIIRFLDRFYEFYYNQDSWEESGHGSGDFNPPFTEVKPVLKMVTVYE